MTSLAWITNNNSYPRIHDLSDLKVLARNSRGLLDPNAAGLAPVRVNKTPELLWASAEKLTRSGMYVRVLLVWRC
jgi:hypothetical protein